MALALARKYRPDQFDEVVGQEAIASTIKGAIESGRTAHAYLFCGPRGVGKTTIARILARALSCEQGPTVSPCGECEVCRSIKDGSSVDFVEVDGASNRGIDEVRNIRDSVRYRPTRARCRIYLIDEVHMLTVPAFNALLKTLEEPPPHVAFFFATTEPHKLPDTIRSRCQRYDFRRIPPAKIIGHLQTICEAEGVEAEPAALAELARSARGALRDALVRLDQVRSFTQGSLTAEAVHQVLGTMSVAELGGWVDDMVSGEVGPLLRRVDALYRAGADLEAFLDQWTEYLRDLMIVQRCGHDDELLVLALSDPQLPERAKRLEPQATVGLVTMFLEVAQKLRTANLPRVLLEAAFIRAASWEGWLPTATINAALAGKLPPPTDAGGSIPAARPGPQTATNSEAARPSAPAPAPAASAAAKGAKVPTQPKGAASGGQAATAAAPTSSDQARVQGEAVVELPGRPVAEAASAPSTAQPAPPPLADLSEEALARAWPQALATIAERMPLLRPLLGRASARVQGGAVELLFGDKGDRFHVGQLDKKRPEQRRAVEQALGEALGGAVELRVRYSQAASGASPKRNRSELEQDPYIKTVKDVFGGSIVDVRRND